MKTTRRQNLPAAAGLVGVLVLVFASDARAQNDAPLGNEHRVTLFPYHRINDKATGFGYLGYVNNPDKD